APRLGIPHVAHRIDHHEGADRDTTHVDARGPEPAAHGALDAEELAHGGARARAHAAFLHRPCVGGNARRVAHGAVGTAAMIAHVQVEDDGARYVRHHGAAHREAAPVLLQVGHDAPYRLETEGTAPCEHHAIDGGCEMARVEKLDAVHARGPARDLERTHGGLIGKNDGAAGERMQVSDVAHPKPGNHACTLANSGSADAE